MQAERVPLEVIISAEIGLLGYEWVGMESVPSKHGASMRVYVDKPGGITIGDLSILDRQLRTVLAVECPNRMFGLELSSPGLDRILFNIEQCVPFIGREVSVRLSRADIVGRKNLRGTLDSVLAPNISILVDENLLTFDFSSIEKIRLIPVLPVAQGKK